MSPSCSRSSMRSPSGPWPAVSGASPADSAAGPEVFSSVTSYSSKDRAWVLSWGGSGACAGLRRVTLVARFTGGLVRRLARGRALPAALASRLLLRLLALRRLRKARCLGRDLLLRRRRQPLPLGLVGVPLLLGLL